MPKPIIRNFGLHWRKDWISWGRQNVAGELLGREKGLNTKIDFREQRGVYALYSDYELVYVGQTTAAGLFQRLRGHRDDHLSERWNRFSWFGTRRITRMQLAEETEPLRPDSSVVIHTLEAVCIAIAEPRLNLQRGHWPKPIKQYYQVDPAH